MSKERIERRIKNAVEGVVPDVLDSILDTCEKEGKNKTMEKTINRKKLYSIIAAAAAFVLIFGAAAGIFMKQSYDAISSVVSLDVNPSIQLALNSSKRIVSATALNDDAGAVLQGLKPEGKNLRDAVTMILSSMIDKGYITEAQNSILISIENDDENAVAEIQQMINEKIEEVLSGARIDTSVILQKVKDENNELKSIADEYNISKGMAKLIKEILASDPLLTYDDLDGVSVNELKLLVESKEIALNDTSSSGKASDISYIGAQSAANIAFADAAVDESAITGLKVELDCEDRRMVYEVEFYVGDYEYEYDIDALTGTIYDREKELRDGYPIKPEEIITPSQPSSIPSPADGATDAEIVAAVCAKYAIDPSSITSAAVQTVGGDNAVFTVTFTDKANKNRYVYTSAGEGSLSVTQIPQTVKPTEDNVNENAGGDALIQDNYIGKEAAAAIATTHAGVDPAAVTLKKNKLDREDGVIVYEIEFDLGIYEYEYEINAITGEIVSWEKEID